MRILHTSDWHLGRSFHGLSLHDITEDLLAELIETVKEEEIDVLLVSGDVYDQAQPRTETVSLLSKTLEELGELGVRVVLSSGNHDSAIRLGFAAQLLARSGVYLATSPQNFAEPVLVEKDGVRVAVYALPYLEPRARAAEFGVVASHAAVLGYATEQVRADLHKRTVDASIVMAHCFVSGAANSDSERDINVGGIETVGAEVFEGFDYAALGHLHGRQKVTETVRYSGSLLAYSFSEENHCKGGWILEVDSSGVRSVTEHSWKTGLHLKTLRGKLSDLVTEPAYERFRDSICRIYLTDPVRPLGALEKLRERFSTVAELYFEPERSEQSEHKNYSERLKEAKSPLEVSRDFYEHVRGAVLTEKESDFIEGVVDRARADEVSA